MEESAVDWLISKIWTTDWVNYSREEKLQVFEQARKIQKKMIIDTVISCASFVTYEESEQYYNKTYGNKEISDNN